MSHEQFPTQPSSHEQNLNNEGYLQLAENLALLTELQDPKAVHEYMEDVLAHTKGEVTISERAAVYDFLSKEQTETIASKDVESGKMMLDRLSARNRTLSGIAGSLGHEIGLNMNKTEASHDQYVGSHFRNKVDPEAAARGNFTLDQEVRSASGSSLNYAKAFQQWSIEQRNTAQDFVDSVSTGMRRKSAIENASKTLNADYEGEPKDLSGVFEREVKIAAAKKIQQVAEIAKQNGEDPKDAINELLASEINNNKKDVVGIFTEMAEDINVSGVSGARRIDEDSQEISAAFRRFVRAGDEGYGRSVRPDDATEAYKRQKRILSELNQLSRGITTKGEVVLRMSNKNIDNVRQRVASLS